MEDWLRMVNVCWMDGVGWRELFFGSLGEAGQSNIKYVLLFTVCSIQIDVFPKINFSSSTVDTLQHNFHSIKNNQAPE